MKQLFLSLYSMLVCSALAVCTREQGLELQRMSRLYDNDPVVTNSLELIRKVVNDEGEYSFIYLKDVSSLSKVKLQRSDGEILIYNYSDGKLVSASCVNTNSGSSSVSMTITQFFGNGLSTGGVDRIEFEMVKGEVRRIRSLDVHGECIKPTVFQGVPLLDVECAPSVGSIMTVGPYVWSVVGPSGESVLLREGKRLISGHFCLAGKYPWIVGCNIEESSGPRRERMRRQGIISKNGDGQVMYIFALDVRSDQIEYIPFTGREQGVKELTGYAYSSFRMWNFWGYALSRRGPERKAALEKALFTEPGNEL